MLVFNGYAYLEVFTARELKIYNRACELVSRVPYELEGKVVRCHELVRAVALDLNLTFADGFYGMQEHSWLWLSKPEQFCPPPRILDVYAPGRIPQVQLVDTNANLPTDYRKGPKRTDINRSQVDALYAIMTSIEETFTRLAEALLKSPGVYSNLSEWYSDPNHLAIVALGEKAVPLILKELSLRPNWWFAALGAITGEDPTSPEDAGCLDSLTEAWLKWGRNKGLMF